MATPREQADQRIQAVEAAFDAAEGEWTGVGVTLGSLFGVSPKQQVLGAIRSMRELGYGPWSQRPRKLADTDQAGWNRWIADGNDMLRNLATTAQDADAASLDGILAATAVATVKQTAEVAAKTATALWD